MAVHYPVEFPFDSAREVVRIFKAGTVAPERSLLAESIWNLQGYAQRMLLGEAHDVANGVISNGLTVFKSQPPATDEEIIQILEEFDKGAAADPTVPRLLFPFDPQTLLSWCLALAGRIL